MSNNSNQSESSSTPRPLFTGIESLISVSRNYINTLLGYETINVKQNDAFLNGEKEYETLVATERAGRVLPILRRELGIEFQSEDFKTGQELANTVSIVYSKVVSINPSIGVRLFDSSVALTLGGYRSYTFLVSRVKSHEEANQLVEDLKKINTVLVESGLDSQFIPELVYRDDFDEMIGKSKSGIVSFDLCNPQGLNRTMSDYQEIGLISKEIPSPDDIGKLLSSFKEKGLVKLELPDDVRRNVSFYLNWMLNVGFEDIPIDVLFNLENYPEITESFLTNEDIIRLKECLITGIQFGYPISACRDYAIGELLEEKGDKTLMSEFKQGHSGIALMCLYDNPIADYHFLQRSRNNTDIKINIKKWGDFLKGFYLSQEHKSIRRSKRFKNERIKIINSKV